MEHTWREILVFPEQRLVGRGLIPTSREVAFQFHMHWVRVGLILRFIDTRGGLVEFSRRGDVENRVLLGRGEPLDNVREKAIYHLSEFTILNVCLVRLRMHTVVH